jgi:hypothetical protein
MRLTDRPTELRKKHGRPFQNDRANGSEEQVAEDYLATRRFSPS